LLHDGIDVEACAVEMREIGVAWVEDKRQVCAGEENAVEVLALD
jgi:hypothetical protein